jgi:hypothetical protein
MEADNRQTDGQAHSTQPDISVQARAPSSSGGQADGTWSADKFIETDFKEAFGMLRYYDTAHWTTTQFTIVQLISAASVAGGIYVLAFGDKPVAGLGAFWQIPTATILFISAVFGYLAVVSLVRERVNFVYTARYVNAIRRHFLSTKPFGLDVNSYYTEVAKPLHYHNSGKQILSIRLIALATAILFGFAMGLIATFIVQLVVNGFDPGLILDVESAPVSSIVAFRLVSVLCFILVGLLGIRWAYNKETSWIKTTLECYTKRNVNESENEKCN